jgi:TAG lipase/steryl ester hydrolase/phospholipase A2/LPA acyltransferase
MEKVSPDYDHCLLETRLEQLRKCRETGDHDTLVFLLRTSLSRNIGGMGNANVRIGPFFVCMY